MGNEAWSKIYQVCMKIWNSKSGGNMYFDFEVIFGVFPEVHSRQAIYLFKALEVRNPMLQTMHKLELK